MLSRIIGLVACLICAVPFFIIAVYKRDSKEPINFWSGDKTLKSKVKNVSEYNYQMTTLYKKGALAFLIAGIGFLIHPILGLVLVCCNCTLGIYLMYRSYKKILSSYS